MNYVYIIFLYTVLILMAYCTCAIIPCYLWQWQFNPDVFYFKKNLYCHHNILAIQCNWGKYMFSCVYFIFFVLLFCRPVALSWRDFWCKLDSQQNEDRHQHEMLPDILHPKNTLIKATQGKINMNYFLFLWIFLFTFVGQSFKTILGLHVHYNIWVLKENQLRTTFIDHLKANGKDSVNARLC